MNETYYVPKLLKSGLLLLIYARPGIDLLKVASENVAGTVMCNTDMANRYPVTAAIDHMETGKWYCLSKVKEAAPKPAQALY